MVHTVDSKTDGELEEFVKLMLGGGIITDKQVPNDMWPSVFLLLALGALSSWTPKEVEQIGVVYGDMKDVAPRSINGYPIFFTIGFLNQADWERVKAAYGRESQRKIEV